MKPIWPGHFPWGSQQAWKEPMGPNHLWNPTYISEYWADCVWCVCLWAPTLSLSACSVLVHLCLVSLVLFPSHICSTRPSRVNSLRPRRNRRYFADDIFKCIFFNENVWISIKVPLKFDPKSPINNIPALVQIMAWRGPGDKPLSEPMMVNLLTHIWVTRPQWVYGWELISNYSYLLSDLTRCDVD